MNFFWRLAVVALLAAGIGIAVLSLRRATPSRVTTSPVARSVALSLGVVLESLALVGVVSQTILRHVIQVAPLLVALLLVARTRVGVAAAAPLLAFWLLLMIAIWLFLLGVARIVSGTFTLAEIVLTVVIAAASVAGLAAAARRGSALPPPTRIAVVAAFAAFQYAAMIASALLLANG